MITSRHGNEHSLENTQSAADKHYAKSRGAPGKPFFHVVDPGDQPLINPMDPGPLRRQGKDLNRG
ncbi:MAG: hypothetical protein QXL31_07090, partial [Thermosphaera sp.]